MNLNKYRDDITGLRGIAVISVVFFHSGLDFFSGGYVGVDVFFILSGYLIADSIHTGMDKKTFSIFSFYERRILRLLPAAITVVFIVLLIGSIILLPEELKELRESALSTLTLSTNTWASNSTSYFGIGVDYKPLIHYWSLAIEFKFYIIFPILIYIFLRNGQQKLLIIFISFLCLVSFIYANFSVLDNPNKSYFSGTMRAWEFALGALVRLLSMNRSVVNISQSSREILVLLGYFLILFPIFYFNDSFLFPGFYALVPCLGAVLILLFGGHFCLVSNYFSKAWLCFIGTVSYSVYLVHQPAMALYRTMEGRGLEKFEYPLLISVSLVLGVLLYFVVEKPLQKKGNYLRFVSPIFILVLSVTVFVLSSSKKEKNITEEVSHYLQYRYDNNPRLNECRVTNKVIDKVCLYGDANYPKVAIWGDSHADQIVFPLSTEFQKQNYSTLEFAVAGCPPIINTRSPNRERLCSQNSERILNYILNSDDVEYVVLHAYWIGYFDEGLISSNSKETTLKDSFRSVLVALVESNKKVKVIYPVPKMKINPPLYLARHAMLNLDITGKQIELSEEEFYLQSKYSLQFLDEAVAGLDVEVIHISNMLFDEAESKFFTVNGKVVLYRDDNHLSLSGGKFIASELVERILFN